MREQTVRYFGGFDLEAECGELLTAMGATTAVRFKTSLHGMECGRASCIIVRGATRPAG